ncbi:uncharacterized protein LOC116840533 [Odontomachus brunneus]|uniref:uncharacterized protein LOC116840533 n=1 Tax=Odontomachus brunneus TaxID=486640 RepID=UPI0013F2AC51|nr:uncharacterized protein LOC116840533 [Odontomachus brunneus]
MLRQLIVPLILGGFVAICSCEPVNRKHLPRASLLGTIECANDEGGTSKCAGINETTSVSTENHEDRTRTVREVEPRSMDDYENYDEPAEVTGRKKRRGGQRILLYMLGAMKAAIIYGLLHGVAALAGKAVLVAKIALAIAIVAILKKNDHEKTSYEIVKHPQHSFVQTHSSSVDYDHRSDYGEDGYEHRKRRRVQR